MKTRHLYIYINVRAKAISLLLLLAVATAVRAQEEGRDSISATSPTDSIAVTLSADSIVAVADSLMQKAIPHVRPQRFTPDPIRAMWLSLILPGAGQIYNHKFWKLPIFYGGFLGCAYALQWNNQMLRDYSQAYLDIMDTDPDTKSYEKMLPMGYNISGREEQFQTIFKNKKNFYRRYRDMSIFAFAAVYALAVIDAYVDAELSTFDITPDLSLRVTPAVICTDTGQRHAPQGIRQTDTALGLAWRLQF